MKPGRVRRLAWMLVLAWVGVFLAAWWARAEQPAGKAVAAGFTEAIATPAQLRALREGGFVLYFRHGHTDNSHPDRVPEVDLNDCSTQRPLTDGGRHVMSEVGHKLRQAGIPVGEVYASPLCRARESAQLAFGVAPIVDETLMYTANMSSARKAPALAATRRLLSEPVAAGSNRVIVAHAPNLMDLIGYFPREATMVIFRPQGDHFEYIASVNAADWHQLVP